MTLGVAHATTIITNITATCQENNRGGWAGSARGCSIDGSGAGDRSLEKSGTRSSSNGKHINKYLK